MVDVFARLVAIALGAGCGRIGFADSAIAWSDTSTAAVPSIGELGVAIPAPRCERDDVAIAVIAMGSTGSPTMAVVMPPDGWTLVRRLDHDNDTLLAVYSHPVGASEPADYTWSWDYKIEGVAWISCYAGVDVASPVMTEAGQVEADEGPGYTAPAVTADAPATLLVTYVSHCSSATPQTTWDAPEAATVRASLRNDNTRSGLGVELAIGPGPTGDLTATTSQTQDYALVHALVLRSR